MARPAVMGSSNLHRFHGMDDVPGWNVAADFRDHSTGGRVMYLAGPARSLDKAQDMIVRKLFNVESMDPSFSGGSAKIALRVAYGAPIRASVPDGDARAPHISVSPATITVDTAAHPYFQDIAKEIRVIDRMIQQGRIDYASRSSGETAKEDEFLLQKYTDANSKERKLAALLNAGVRQYEVAGLSLSVTRHYKPETTPCIASDYGNINKVFAWGNISCGGMTVSEHVNTEPMAVIPDASGAFNAIPLEWRCTGVSPAYQRGQDTVVSWSFFGVEKWLGLFYQGGSGAYTL